MKDEESKKKPKIRWMKRHITVRKRLKICMQTKTTKETCRLRMEEASRAAGRRKEEEGWSE